MVELGHGSNRVAVRIKRIGSIGPLPTSEISFASSGIDWDAGTFILTPKVNLIEISDEDLKKKTKEHSDAGWKFYEELRKGRKNNESTQNKT